MAASQSIFCPPATSTQAPKLRRNAGPSAGPRIPTQSSAPSIHQQFRQTDPPPLWPRDSFSMARTKSVAPEALAAVGAEALAEVLVDHADTDPALRKKLAMLLAGTDRKSTR